MKTKTIILSQQTKRALIKALRDEIQKVNETLKSVEQYELVKELYEEQRQELIDISYELVNADKIELKSKKYK